MPSCSCGGRSNFHRATRGSRTTCIASSPRAENRSGFVRLERQGVTVNAIVLLFKPPTFTTTFPVAAPFGTVTVMVFAAHVTTGAGTLLNVTALAPCVAPKLMPTIVTGEPTRALPGDTDTMAGVGKPDGLFGFDPGLRYCD